VSAGAAAAVALHTTVLQVRISYGATAASWCGQDGCVSVGRRAGGAISRQDNVGVAAGRDLVEGTRRQSNIFRQVGHRDEPRHRRVAPTVGEKMR
jgi:hypothetical protein